MTEQNVSRNPDLINGKRAYSRAALGASVIIIVVSVVQIAAVILINIFIPEFKNSEYYIWTVAELPMYILGFPAGFLLLRFSVPAVKPERHKISAGAFLTAFCASMLAISVGSTVGQIVAALTERVFGRSSADSLDLFLDNRLLSLIFIALIGPIFEELYFRKFVIDRVLPYGEKTAVFASAFIFALFHGNLEQFFYAFAVGIVFGYLYIRYGTAFPGMILHVLINLIGGVLVPWLYSNTGETDITSVETLTNPFFYITSAIGLLRMALSFTGLILLIVFRKKIFFRRQTNELEKSDAFRAVFLNAGMVIFIVLETANIVMSFFQ